LPGTSRAGDGIHHAIEIAVVGVDVNFARCPVRTPSNLRFLEVRGYVHLVEWNQREQQVPRQNVLSEVYGQLGHLTGDRALNRCVAEIELGLVPHGLGAFDGCLGRLVRCFGDRNLLLASLRFKQKRLRARTRALDEFVVARAISTFCCAAESCCSADARSFCATRAAASTASN
jgi:hypothetical protein